MMILNKTKLQDIVKYFEPLRLGLINHDTMHQKWENAVW